MSKQVANRMGVMGECIACAFGNGLCANGLGMLFKAFNMDGFQLNPAVSIAGDGMQDNGRAVCFHLEAYHQHEVIQRGYSQAYHNQVINALKHLLYQCPEAALHPEALARPRKQKRLPTVLAKAEVKQILDAIPNPKHRLILSLTYACGLRRAEVLALTPKDIDGQRHMLHIRQSKGAKDRMVPLPPVPSSTTSHALSKPETPDLPH